MHRLIHIKKPKESGQALVEFALALVIFVPIFFCILDFGWMSFQRIMFEHGYMHASWEISASDLGDNDPLEEDPSTAVYTGAMVSDILYDEIDRATTGLIRTNLNVTNAQAELYNESVPFTVPGRTEGLYVEASRRTRYIDLSAKLSYTIYPLTPIGSAIFGSSITVEKELTRTRVVGSQNRSE